MNPEIAEKYFKNEIFPYSSKLQSCTRTIEITQATHAPILKEFGIAKPIKFLIAHWHNKYDCLISVNDLIDLKCTINLNEKKLTFPNTEIPFKTNIHKNKTFHIPIKNGNVIVPSIQTHTYNYPEVICHVNNFQLQYPFEINNYDGPYIYTENLENYQIAEPQNQINNQIKINQLIRTSHMNEEEKLKITQLCHKYKSVFYNPNDKLSATNAVSHHIRVKNDDPIYVKNFRYPYYMKKEIQNQITKLLNDGIIQHSVSPYSSPVWIVNKKLDASGEKKYRMVIDFRKLNDVTIENKYPLPRIEEILENLGKSQYFTTLDLAQGFHQIPLDKSSIEKTAFTVENGHYEYLRMPFGLKNAPATFQKMMDTVLQEYLHKCCFVYMDDIVVYSKSLQEHLTHLSKIFQKLQDYQLKVQLDKSEFLRKDVPFLGHIITNEGIKPNSEKIKAIQNYPLPKSIKEIQAFLGLIGYYRKFIKNFSHLTKPFTKCLRKNEKIDPNNHEYLKSFHLCKEAITNSPILAYPDFNKTFILTTDASNVAIGSVLSQNGKPISFHSRTLNSAERNYSTIEKELLAIVDSCKHFRPYLYGQKFIIETDHKPLTWLFSLKEPNQRLIRWKLRLEEYNYDIRYTKGKENKVADALSRVELNALEDLDSITPQCNLSFTQEELDQILNEEIPPLEETFRGLDQNSDTAL